MGFFPKYPECDPLGTPVRPPAISMLNMAQPELTKVLMQGALWTGYMQVVFSEESVSITDDGSTGSNVAVSVKNVHTGLLED